MPEIIDEFVDPKTKEKWQVMLFTPDSFYPCWLDYFRNEEDDTPYCAAPLTEGAEEWLRAFLNGRADGV